MVVHLCADEIHILQPGLSVNLQALIVLGKKTEPLPHQENGDEGQYHDCHDRIAPEKGFDRIIYR